MYKDTKMDIWNLNYLIYWGEHKMLPESRNKPSGAFLLPRIFPQRQAFVKTPGAIHPGCQCQHR